MEISKELKKETEKWLKKIENLKIIAKNDKGEEFKNNIEAYIHDSKYFLKRGDLIRAFEAIVWAWAFFEILKELNFIEDTI
ncbi:MAG TPA: DUF357 domain-containing protein [Candidatus Aenigmarchaeota archaeon]|nr:DUF357 domain-containing protein [Candidatus Aenigmarchaeota archaeon]